MPSGRKVPFGREIAIRKGREIIAKCHLKNVKDYAERRGKKSSMETKKEKEKRRIVYRRNTFLFLNFRRIKKSRSKFTEIDRIEDRTGVFKPGNSTEETGGVEKLIFCMDR